MSPNYLVPSYEPAKYPDTSQNSLAGKCGIGCALSHADSTQNAHVRASVVYDGYGAIKPNPVPRRTMDGRASYARDI